MSTAGIYKNQVTMNHNSRQLTSGFFCKVKIIERSIDLSFSIIVGT